jgi:hypothetical protein
MKNLSGRLWQLNEARSQMRFDRADARLDLEKGHSIRSESNFEPPSLARPASTISIHHSELISIDSEKVAWLPKSHRAALAIS